MKLKKFLKCFNANELVIIITNSLSDGAYTVRELLKRKEILDKEILHTTEIRLDKAEDLVAEDSEFRDDFFQPTVELPYIMIEINN